jgi:hypothetical protein
MFNSYSFEENKDYLLSRFECFEHAKMFFNVLSFEHVNFGIHEKYSKNIMTIQIIMLPL